MGAISQARCNGRSLPLGPLGSSERRTAGGEGNGILAAARLGRYPAASLASRRQVPDMKIATYNVTSIRRRLPLVLDWLRHHQPEVMCLQETKVQDQDFPVDALRDV